MLLLTAPMVTLFIKQNTSLTLLLAYLSLQKDSTASTPNLALNTPRLIKNPNTLYQELHLEFDAFIIYLYYCKVMLDRLPDYIDPLQLADNRGALKGRIPLKSLDRLAEILADDTGTVAIDLFFGREGRLAKIEGHIETVLQLVCQNCLTAVAWPIDSTIKLGVVTSIDQANRLPEDYEPLLVDEGKILLKNIIEDEILLILPAFPKHQPSCIAPKTDNNNVVSLVHDEPSSPEKPFSILAKLKHTGDL